MRATKVLSVLSLFALALVLSLTACSDNNRNSNSPTTEGKATFNVDVAIPQATTKTLADTRQLLLYLKQDNKEMAGTAVIYTAPGDTPVREKITAAEYTEIAAQGSTPKVYECVYETDKVNVSNITLVIEYLSQSGEVRGKAFVDCPQGVKAGEQVELTSVGNRDFRCIQPEPTTMTVVNPYPIEVIAGESQAITITFQWDEQNSEDHTATSKVVSADPEIATANHDQGKLLVNGLQAGKTTLNITHQYGSVPKEVTVKPAPGPDTYTLKADFSGLTELALPKDDIESVKFASHEAAISGEVATATDMNAGEYTLTFTDINGNTYVTKSPINFAKESAVEGVITKKLQDSDFPALFRLVVKYGDVNEIFDTSSVESVSSEIGDFTVAEGGGSAVYERKHLDQTANLTLIFVALDGKQTATTKEPIAFDPATATENGDIVVELSNENFPDYYHLQVDCSGVSKEKLDINRVENVLFDGFAAYIEPEKSMASLYCVDFDDEEEVNCVIEFLGDDFHVKTNSLTFAKEQEKKHCIVVSLTDGDISDQDYTLDLDLTDAGFQELGQGQEITKAKLNETECEIEEGHATTSAPLGTYSLVLLDAGGNEYPRQEDVVFMRPESGMTSTVTVTAEEFDQPEFTLSLDFNDADVKKTLQNEPTKVVLVDDDVEIQAPVALGSWLAVSNEKIGLTGEYKFAADVYSGDTKLFRLKDDIVFERSKAAHNDITVEVTTEMIHAYKLQVEYGSENISVVDLTKISNVTIGGAEASITEKSQTTFIAVTSEKRLPGTHNVTLQCASGTKNLDLTFVAPGEAEGDTMVAQFTNAEFPDLVNYHITVTDMTMGGQSVTKVNDGQFADIDLSILQYDQEAHTLDAYCQEQDRDATPPVGKIRLITDLGEPGYYSTDGDVSLNDEFAVVSNFQEGFVSTPGAKVTLDYSGVTIGDIGTPNVVMFEGRGSDKCIIQLKAPSTIICNLTLALSIDATLFVVFRNTSGCLCFVQMSYNCRPIMSQLC